MNIPLRIPIMWIFIIEHHIVSTPLDIKGLVRYCHWLTETFDVYKINKRSISYAADLRIKIYI